VPAKRLVASGYGEFDPIASNKAPHGRARNRRIEILLTPSLDPKAIARSKLRLAEAEAKEKEAPKDKAEAKDKAETKDKAKPKEKDRDKPREKKAKR